MIDLPTLARYILTPCYGTGGSWPFGRATGSREKALKTAQNRATAGDGTQKRGSRRLRRHGRYINGAALCTLGFCTSWVIDMTGQGPEWLRVEHVDLHLKHLPPGLAGLRIVHISDLHLSLSVSKRYIEHCVRRVNRLRADVIVLTGDYTTHDPTGRFRRRAVDILARLRSRFGVFACLGNHDYGVRGILGFGYSPRMYDLIVGLRASGIHVLRNEAARLSMGDHALWLVGLGDLWARDFDPRRAFDGVPPNQPVIAMVHNPLGAERLRGFHAGAVVSGHTHGRRVQFVNSSGLRLRRRKFQAGLYDVDGKKLYVNCGLGRHGDFRPTLRPEITVLRLCEPLPHGQAV